MVGDEHDDAAAGEHDDRADRIPGSEQVEGGQAIDDRRRERDHRRHRGDGADHGRVGQADRDIDDAEKKPLGEADQNQPGHRAVHRGDHVPRDALAVTTDQPVAEAAQLAGQRVAVAEQKKQGE